MAWLFESGHAADIVLAAMLAEALVLIGVRGREVRAVAVALMPGALIVLALRVAMTGGAWWWMMLALLAALGFHLADLAARPLPGKDSQPRR